MFRVTEKWIHEHQTGVGGWNASQLECIGVSWPPVQGWISQTVGKEISDTQKFRFEWLRGKPPKARRAEHQQALFPTDPAGSTGSR